MARTKILPLIEIRSMNPNIRVELKYATPKNFTGQIVYEFTDCLLLKSVALALSNVQKELETKRLGIKIWDAYRPMAAQWKFWELFPDERYVSDPRKGGRHTRGTAVDLTLVDQAGEELPMPTEFDHFTEKAHRDSKDASAEEIKNRNLLRNVMEKHGFLSTETEWWHFDFAGWENCPPLEGPQ